MITKNDINEVVAEAFDVLKRGGLILYPTDTVWGIGCDATNEAAVQRVFALKRRAEAKSLVLLACDLDMVARYIRKIPSIAVDLVSVNDAPMTIVYPGAVNLAAGVVAEEGTAAIRIPSSSEFCVQLIRRFGKALVSTSANFSGEPAPVCYAEIPIDLIEAADWVADPCLEEGATGEPSQIIQVGLHGEIKIIRE